MTDLDLMTDTQMWIMGIAAALAWGYLIAGVLRRPRRRETYRKR